MSVNNAKLVEFFASSQSRAWVLSAIAGVTAALIYLFLITPAEESHLALRDTVKTLEEKQETMTRTLRRLDLTKKHFDAMTLQLEKMESEGLLTPLLESYAMRCRSLLDPLAKQHSFTLETFRELPTIALPLPKGPLPAQLYTRQPIECSGSGSYAALVNFVRAVETHYPLAVLSGISISPHAQDPLHHRMTLVFEWPIKGALSKDALAQGRKQK
ncbi:MAG: hypothetical protein RSD41_02110 [Kiritimatiellia bacterium]